MKISREISAGLFDRERKLEDSVEWECGGSYVFELDEDGRKIEGT